MNGSRHYALANSFAVFAVVFVFAALVVQIATARPSQSAVDQVVGNPTIGKSLFKQESCGSCHTLAAADSKGTIGPDLNTLKPSEATVEHQVTSGGGFMPSFGGRLSTKEIDDIAAFVYTSTHK